MARNQLLHRLREVIKYRSMLYSLIMSELRTRYRASVLGFLWTFINPLLMLIVYSIVFSIIMRINMNHYSVFLFIGLLGWNMFATAVQSSSGVIIRQSSMVNKIYFPREILPLSVVGGSVFNYILSLVVLIPVLFLYGYWPTWLWLFFPLILLVGALMTAGFSLIFSALNVYFRDFEHMLGIFIMLWFYLTPIVYPISLIPKGYVNLIKLNPVVSVVLSLQDIFYYHQPLRWRLFLYGSIFAVIIFITGWKLFDRLSRRFAEEV